MKLLKSFLLLNMAIAVNVGYAQAVAEVTAQVGQSEARANNAAGAKTFSVNLSNAPLDVAVRTIASKGGVAVMYSERKLPAVRVSYSADKTTTEVALREVLKGTGIGVEWAAKGQIALVHSKNGRSVAGQGVIAGKVTDAKSGKGVSGATVSIGSDTRGATTGADGAYRLTGIASGAQAVVVRLVGYAKQTRIVTVGEGAIVTADFKLEPSANVLDQVVVTGTATATELKAVPNAITVITAKQIEERGITRIDQLFRGDIPGLFAMNQGADSPLEDVAMFSRGATALSSASAGTSFNTLYTTNPIKTYVDGIELANSIYLSQIDPKSIERIEILTGPQASTIYGSNAINGVMQIFTKRGSSPKPQATINLLSGWVENNFSSAHTPQHDHSVQLNGVEGRMSYNVGSSWNYTGAWAPAKQTSRTNVHGGTRLELPAPRGPLTMDVTLARGFTQNKQRGVTGQLSTNYSDIGWYNFSGSRGLSQAVTATLASQTLGLTATYSPIAVWSHELQIGKSTAVNGSKWTSGSYSAIGDTILSLFQFSNDRRSFQYVTTLRTSIANLIQGTITVGADAWQSLGVGFSVRTKTLTGSLIGPTSVSRQPGHNTGSFVQTQLGFADRFFLTYGLRAEWNPDYGAEAQPNMVPRLGAAYTHEIGSVTAKLRGSYGRSTRPPQTKLKAGLTMAQYYESSGYNWASAAPYYTPYYGGMLDYQLANPELGPEHQQGGEGGLELYLGTRGSLVVTRYNQTVDGLIDQPVVDSVRTLIPCPYESCFADTYNIDGYGYNRQYQYLNIGSIRNQGWELQGSINTGPFTTRGTYSWTKSRVIGITPKYRPYFASDDRYQPGASFRFMPEHTWALGMTYARGASSVGINVMGIGRVRKDGDEFFFHNLSSNIRLQQNRLNVTNIGRYSQITPSYALSDLRASYRFTYSIEGLLQVQNLTDMYKNDRSSNTAAIGRQVKVGLRARTR